MPAHEHSEHDMLTAVLFPSSLYACDSLSHLFPFGLSNATADFMFYLILVSALTDLVHVLPTYATLAVSCLAVITVQKCWLLSKLHVSDT